MGRSPDLEKLKQDIMTAGKELCFDVALQKDSVFRKSKRLIVFNMEGTLIDTDLVGEIARVAGVNSALSKLAEKTEGNEFNSEKNLSQRVALLKGVSIDALEYVANKLNLTKGAKELVGILRGMGYKIALISNSFTFFTDKLKEELGLDYTFGNKLVLINGCLSGELEEPIIDGAEKASIMLEIAEKEKIPTDQIVAVGNGVDDIEMLNKAGMGIVFHAKGEYKNYYAGSIVQTNLKSILYMLGANEENLI